MSATYYVKSGVAAEFIASHTYNIGDIVVCTSGYATTARRAFVYQCTVGGLSSTEPTWPTSGTITSGAATFTTLSPTSWSLATPYLVYGLTACATTGGDIVKVSKTHSESKDWASNTRTFLGSTAPSLPTYIFCVDDASSDALAVGALVYHSGTTAMTYSGSAYCYGVTFKTATTTSVLFGSGSTITCWTFESDGTINALWLTTTGNVNMSNGSTGNTSLKIINSNIEFDSASSYITGSNNVFEWWGGALTAGNGLTSELFNFSSHAPVLDIRDVDLTQVAKAGSTTYLVAVNAPESFGGVRFTRCKLSTDANFNITRNSWVNGANTKVILHHCSGGNDTYSMRESCYFGDIYHETTLVRSGGFTDPHGTTLSWKMVTNANPAKPYTYLISPPITVWNTFAVSKTFTIECLVDSATNFQNDMIWMELEYPANNTDGLGARAIDRVAILGTPADKSASAGATWTTTGMSNPNKFHCAVTVTPGKAGPVTARIYFAAASKTAYIDPLITVS